MPIIYTVDRLLGIAEDTGNLLQDVALNASKQYCRIRQKYPNLTRSIAPIQQMWDNYCAVQEIPPSPLPYQEFEGGQCSGDFYRVSLEFARNLVDRCNFAGKVNTATLNAQGKILGLRAAPTGTDRFSSCNTDLPIQEQPLFPEYIVYLATESVPEYTGVNGIIFFLEFDPDNIFPIAAITGIENVSNPSDSCGDPPIYPPDPTQDPADFSVTFSNNQQVNNQIEVNQYTFNFDSTDLDIDAGFNVPVQVNIGGKQQTDFSVDFNGGDIEINRRGGGSIGGGGSGGGGESSPNTQPSTDFQPPSAGGEYEEEIIESANDIEPDPTEQDIAFVLVDVTLPPAGDKTILFSDSENNTFFAGYIAWIQVIDGKKYRYPEIPIRKTFNIFEAPLGTKTFKAYAVNRAEISVKILRQPVEPE